MLPFTYICLVLVVILFQMGFAPKNKLLFYSFMALKVLAALGVELLYRVYYNGAGDTLLFFEMAKQWYQLFTTDQIDFWQWIGLSDNLQEVHWNLLPASERSRFFTLVVSLLMPLGQSNYTLISMMMSVVTGLCIWLFATKLLEKLDTAPSVVYAALLFVPSLLFWSSGILKETLMLSFMACIGIAYLSWLKKANVLSLIAGVLFILLLWKLKYYVPILLVPLVVATHFFSRSGFSGWSFPKKVLFYFAVLLIGFALVSFAAPCF